MGQQERFRIKTTERSTTAYAGLLQARLITLAGTPDDNSVVDTDLIIIAQLAANLISPVDHASVTRGHDHGYATVAASSDLALALDEAQYDDKTGPCLEALEAGYPTAAPDIAATVTWPGFRDAAAGSGVLTSLSIPLFAGSGRTIAALNLYSHRYGGLQTLTTAVWTTFEPDTEPWDRDALDAGGRELIAGLIGAVGLRNMIQRAVGVITAATGESAQHAYMVLRTRAAAANSSLTDAAAEINEQQRP